MSAFSISPTTKPPAPDDYYLGQRRLTAEIRDIYGQLIDGMQGTRGQIRTGGDGDAGAMEGSPPAQKPVALYSGLVTVKRDGTAEVLFDIPAFAGTVRVMAVAWSKDKVGKATGDVTVRDPVVLTATLPRFLRVGDNGTMNMDIDNVEGAAGSYAIAVTASGAASVTERATQTLSLRCETAKRRVRAVVGQGGRRRDVQCEGHRPVRLQSRAHVCAGCEAGDAGAGAPHREAAGERGESYALERYVRRSRAGIGRRFRSRSGLRARSMPRPCSRRSIAIRSAVPNRSQAVRCRFFM